MNLDQVDPELLPALKRLPSLDNSRRLVRMLGRFGPQLLPATRLDSVTTTIVRDGAFRARLYQPVDPTSDAALLWIHGGGLVIGAAKQDDKLCAETSDRLGITVVSIEYRLAPESPFPAALDDAFAAWHWMQTNGTRLGINPSRIAIGGESAGGGIAASLVQRLHDTSEVQPIAQWLFAPMLDDRTAAQTELDVIDHPVWNNRSNRFGWSAYLRQEPGLAETPEYAVPARRADLNALPPTWLYAGDIELFRGEIEEYARRLAEAGVPVEFELIPGAAHGFENWAGSTTLATSLIARAQNWLASALH